VQGNSISVIERKRWGQLLEQLLQCKPKPCSAGWEMLYQFVQMHAEGQAYIPAYVGWALKLGKKLARHEKSQFPVVLNDRCDSTSTFYTLDAYASDAYSASHKVCFELGVVKSPILYVPTELLGVQKSLAGGGVSGNRAQNLHYMTANMGSMEDVFSEQNLKGHHWLKEACCS
jgi:hypothetical protein